MNTGMTFNDFLNLLEKHGKGKFQVDKNDNIRTIEDDICPICFLCEVLYGERYSNFNYLQAGEMLGIAYGLRNLIIDGADLRLSENGARFSRAQLLHALGLDL